MLISAWLGLNDADDHQQFPIFSSGFHGIGDELSGFEKKWNLIGADSYRGIFTSNTVT